MRAAKAAQVKAKVVANKARNTTSVKVEKKVHLIALAGKKAKRKELSDSQRDDLILSHREKAQKMALSILRKWRARLDLDEVQSLVDLSLCEAVKNFNPSKGASFMTFLYYHLRGNLIRTVSLAASANGVPMCDHQSLEADLTTESYSFSSTDMAEALSDRDALMPDEIWFRKEMSAISKRACQNLDELERQIVYRVFMGEEQLLDIAKSLGYSRCHISRVKRKALDALYKELSAVDGCDENLREIIDLMKEDRLPRRRLVSRRGAHRRLAHSSVENSEYAHSLAI